MPEPSVLEKPQKGEQEGSTVVCHPPGLSPPHQTHPRQATRRPRHAIKATEMQTKGNRTTLRPHSLTTRTLHLTHHRTKPRLGQIGKEHRTHTETASTTHTEIET